GWIGSPPYAYKVEGPKKGKRLVIDDPGKVRIVQRIFREFVDGGRALHNIAAPLNTDGVVSPGGFVPGTRGPRGRVRGWRYGSVKVILENPAYTGDFAACRSYYGKYHHIEKGDIGKSSSKKGKDGKKDVWRGRNPKEKWIIHPDHHEAIIDRATFDKAQEILDRYRAKDRDGRPRQGRSRHTPEENPYVLSCLLRCGRCGSKVYGITKEGRRYYECGNRHYNGNDSCAGTTVREDVVLRGIADHLENWLGLDGDALGTAAFYGKLDLSADDLPE